MRYIIILTLLSIFSFTAVAEEAATQAASPAQKLADASKAVYEALLLKLKIVSPTPEYVELITTASRALRDAEISLAKTKAKRIAAAEDNLARMKALFKTLKDRTEVDVDLLQLSQANYAIAEAEVFLEKERAAEEKK